MPHRYWQDRTALVTLGPTRAPLDPVRYLANTSSGRLGNAIVEALLEAGARVAAVVGEGATTPAPRPELALHPVSTVDDLLAAVRDLAEAPHPDLIVHLMAVLDYVPAAPSAEKLPSDKKRLKLELVPTPKVIDEMRRLFPTSFLVGFKLESGVPQDRLIEAGRQLLTRSGADAVVCNLIEETAPTTHRAWMVDTTGALVEKDPWVGKEEIARRLVHSLPQLMPARREAP